MPENKKIDAVVAGHICLDIIPTLSESQTRPEDLFMPGRLLKIGPATTALGGVVSNTGLALHQLGFQTRLVGQVGDDLFGHAVVETLSRKDPKLTERMLVVPGESTSYSVVMSPPGVDRCFLHCPGANDTLRAENLPIEELAGARLMHFGYPPLMQAIYSDEGVGLAQALEKAQKLGIFTSLDMAMPDPTSPAIDVDWHAWLKNVLPSVDLFIPSLDELLMMLDRDCYDRLAASAPGDNLAVAANGEFLEEISGKLLDLGARIVVLKLGDQGLYLRTGQRVCEIAGQRLLDKDQAQAWANLQLLAPCYQVDVVGTTGSGDCTIAGFLAGLLEGGTPDAALRSAVGVGACCVQSPDATSGVPTIDEVRTKTAGWGTKDVALSLDGWEMDQNLRIFQKNLVT